MEPESVAIEDLHPPRPPELVNIGDLEKRLEAYVAHSSAEFDKADAEYQRLHAEHCSAAKRRVEHWSDEHGRAFRLLNMLREARRPPRGFGGGGGGGGGGGSG